jgi:hypothetical protein
MPSPKRTRAGKQSGTKNKPKAWQTNVGAATTRYKRTRVGLLEKIETANLESNTSPQPQNEQKRMDWILVNVERMVT